MELKKALPNNILAWIWLSKSPTRQESGHEKFLPDMIFLLVKYMIILIVQGMGVQNSE